MKRLKMTLSLLLVSTFFITLPAGFAATKTLSLEEAITLSKENSASIRGVLNQEFSTQNTIRQNVQNSYQLERGLDTYYDYISIYNRVVDADNEYSGVHPYYRYIGKSSDYLNSRMAIIQGQIVEATMAGQSDKVSELSKEAEFIGLYGAFGDDPSLTKESKYEKIKKNEAMLQNSVDLINTQYEQGLIATTRGTEAGTIKLYVAITDLKQGIDVKKDLLQTYEDGLKNMEDSYKQGLVSKVDYDNQISTVEIQRLETANLQYQYDNLTYQLKQMCEIPMTTNLNLSTSFGNGDYEVQTPASYYETAYSNNMDYVNLTANLTYNEKKLPSDEQVFEDTERNHDFTQPIYYQEKVDQQETIDDLNKELNNKKLLVNANVTYAYNDLQVKKKQVEFNDDALKYASAQLNSGIQSFKLGQITQLQLDQLRIQYASATMTADQNVRAYNTGVENFKLLINYGVTY